MDALEDACKLSEPEFRQQLITWMQTKEVNQRIQAKLRHDIIDCFSATALGREVSMRQQNVNQYIVPPTAILALNTMVAEFLYSQNCQFTLSVFATEVPFPSALPDFESAKNVFPYRFRQDQLKDLLRSFALSQQSEKDVQSKYSKPTNDHINTSLLFILLESLCHSEAKERTMSSKSTQCKGLTRRRNHEDTKQRKNNKCLRQVEKWLKQLADSMEVLSQSMEHFPLAQSLNIAKHNLTKLHRHILRISHQHISHSIVETLSSLSETMNSLIDRIQFKVSDNKPIPTSQMPEIPNDNTMRYTDWVQAIRSSMHGKRFLQHLVEHYKREQQCEMEKHKSEMLESIKAERTRLKQMYKERFLNRLQGLMVAESDTSKGRFLSDIRKPEENSQIEVQPVGEQDRTITKQLNQMRLSSRKLPAIQICPEGDTNDLAVNPLSREINQIAQQTRQRAQQLIDQSDDIESSFQKRLQKHSLDTRTITVHQQHIRQRCHFDTKLISSFCCDKTVKSPRNKSGSMEVKCESSSLPVADGNADNT